MAGHTLSYALCAPPSLCTLRARGGGLSPRLIIVHCPLPQAVTWYVTPTKAAGAPTPAAALQRFKAVAKGAVPDNGWLAIGSHGLGS